MISQYVVKFFQGVEYIEEKERGKKWHRMERYQILRKEEGII